VQQHQTVSERAQEVLERQAKALAHQSGYSLEDARQAVSDTEAGRQLRDWHKVSIAMRRPRTGRGVYSGGGPRRD
jgi:hypothetical protein